MSNFESSYTRILIEQFRKRRMALGVAQTSVDDRIESQQVLICIVGLKPLDAQLN